LLLLLSVHGAALVAPYEASSTPAHPDIDLLVRRVHAYLVKFLQDQRVHFVGARGHPVIPACHAQPRLIRISICWWGRCMPIWWSFSRINECTSW